MEMESTEQSVKRKKEMESTEQLAKRKKEMDSLETLEIPASQLKLDPALAALPEEMVTEILVRLPAKSVCRFRSVNKDWLGLLGDAKFLGSRLEPRFEVEIQQRSSLLYVTRRGEERHCNLMPALQNHEYVISYRSVKDFICFQSNSGNLYMLDKIGSTFYSLPPVPLGARYEFEFGFDHVIGGYKILTWSIGSSNCEFYVASVIVSNSRPRLIDIGSINWRRPIGEEPLIEKEIEKTMVISSGIVYLYDGEGLITFNLETEQFGQIALPNEHGDIDFDEDIDKRIHPDDDFLSWSGALPEYPNSGMSCNDYDFFQSIFHFEFFEYLDQLCVVEFATITSVTEFEGSAIEAMWVLKDDGKSWSKIVRTSSLPVHGIAGSDVWCRKHSRFSSTKLGDHILVTCAHENILSVLIYSIFNPSFSQVVIGSYSQDACCIEV